MNRPTAMIAKPMASPMVSILMPTYNYARFLPEAIESVLSQEFRDFELVIIDDCSKDNTEEVVQAWCGRDKRIRFLVNPTNLGMVNNWNRSLEEARGTYIKYLFGDDKLARPNAVGKLVEMLGSDARATLAASAREILDDKSAIMEVWQTMREGRHDGLRAIVTCLLQDRNLIGEPSAVLFRKADAWPGFNPQLRQVVDVEMWFRLLERGRLIYTREPLCAFRRHHLQQTVANSAGGLALEEHQRLFAHYLQKSWMPGGKRRERRRRFTKIYDTRKRSRLDGANASDDGKTLPPLGKGWYVVYWLERRATRPIENLAAAIGKLRKPTS